MCVLVYLFCAPNGESTQGPPHFDYRNSCAIPVQDTIYSVPWASCGKFQEGAVLCNILTSDGHPSPFDTRFIAEKQLTELRQYGYELLSGFEVELLAFDKYAREPTFKGCDGLYHLTLSQKKEFICSLDDYLRQIGIDIMAMHTEEFVDQYEFAMSPTIGIKAADDMFRFKEAVKEIGLAHNLIVTAVTKAVPLAKHFDYGLGLQMSHSLIMKQLINSNHVSKIGECLYEKTW